MKDFLGKTLIVSAMVFAGPFAPGAQAAQPNAPPSQAEPERSPQPTPLDGAQMPPHGDDDLSHSQGVLTPPDIRDPAVKAPNQPASPGMPVIRPPGTPGGRQDVEPK